MNAITIPFFILYDVILMKNQSQVDISKCYHILMRDYSFKKLSKMVKMRSGVSN